MSALQPQNENMIGPESPQSSARNGWRKFGRAIAAIGCVYILLSIFLPVFQPTAQQPTQSQMTYQGISLEGNRYDTMYFGIIPGKEEAAGRDLLTAIANGFEVCLRNDLDEGLEGCTFFRKSSSGLETMVGGHGWQSKWKPTDKASVMSAVVELADLNRGGHWSTRGSLELSR